MGFWGWIYEYEGGTRSFMGFWGISGVSLGVWNVVYVSKCF